MNDRNRDTDLLKLADAFYANLEREERMEYGGWGLDDKRPFGNSDVTGDILRLIDFPPAADDYYSREQEGYADDLYVELGGFLQKKWIEYRQASDPKGADSVQGGNDDV